MRLRMRNFLFGFLVYALFVCAGTCFCLALLCLLGGTALWFGLQEPAGLKLGVKLLVGGLAALAGGFVVLARERRLAPCEAPGVALSPGDPKGAPDPERVIDDSSPL